MLNPFWNFASPTKNIIAQNKPTDAANINYSYQNEILKGALFIKLKNSNIQKLSDNCLIEINNFSDDYDCLLRIKYNGNNLIINNDIQLFQFSNSHGNKCITWQKDSSHYVLELFQEKRKKNKENIFLINLPAINPISIDNSEYLSQTKSYTKSKYVNNIVQKKPKENSLANKNIDKNLFIKRFEEYKEIYIVKGTAFIYDKLLEDVIPFKNMENNCNKSYLKVNYIGNNAYILVLEQNNKIISFIKIVNTNDISINESSGSISFNYMNNEGENNPYIFSFEEKSMNEMKFFKKLILRCIYEKNNSNFDFNNIPNFLNFDSMDINSEFSQELDSNKSFLFSTSKKQNEKFIFPEETNNDMGKNKNFNNTINDNIYSDIDKNKININLNKNFFTKNSENIERFQDHSNLRLFNGKMENIKNIMTGTESSIRYLDSSHDNKYLLITCDKYLVVINNDNKIGIEPIFLRLDQGCLNQYNIANKSFTYAKFITDENSKEKMIIANIEQYVILWNFEKVIRGENNCYRIINAN